MADERILITGGSGLIGSRLTELLASKGWEVAHLGRSKKSTLAKHFTWNIDNGRVEENALDNVHTIVHLAGASVGSGRWTRSRKKEILDSRILSTRLLLEAVRKTREVKTLITASGVNYYGYDRGKTFSEEDPGGHDFLSTVTQAWEREADRFADHGVRVVKLRIGMVLSRQGGALPRLALPVRLFVGAPLGRGHQVYSWIHIDDLCGIIIKAIKDQSMVGAYNAVAPSPVTNGEMTRALAASLRRPLWLPSVPGIILRLVLGEMADIALEGNRVSCERILSSGYRYRFPNITSALKEIYGR